VAMCKSAFYLFQTVYSNKQNPLSSLVEVVHKGGGWDERDRRLILWHFEELLKQRYKEFIEVLEVEGLLSITLQLMLHQYNLINKM